MFFFFVIFFSVLILIVDDVARENGSLYQVQVSRYSVLV